MKKNLLLAAVITLAAAIPMVHAYDVKAPGCMPVKFQASPKHAPLVMIKDGKLNFVIAADLQAEEQMRGKNRTERSIAPAIEIIQEALEKCTGQKAEVVDIANLPAGKLAIVVGDNAVTRANGIAPSKMADQELAVKTFEGGIIVAGNDSSLIEGYNMKPLESRGSSNGTKFGAYDFVERFLGVRYFFPGQYGTLWPQIRDLTIEPVSYTDKPYFKNRNGMWYVSYCTTANPKGKEFWSPYLGPLTKEDDQFAMRWRFGGTVPGGGSHCPRPERIAKAYPDQLKTIFYTSPSGNFWYNPHAHVGNIFDVTNLKFADLLMESLKKYYGSDGKIDEGGYRDQCCNSTYVSFGVCDTMMPDCDIVSNPTVKELGLITEKDLSRGDERATMANVYARFHQYLAKRMEKELPGKKLYIMAYYNVQCAGTDPRWTLPSNTEVNLCLGVLPNYTRNPKKMAKAVQMAKEWYESIGNRPVQKLWLYQGTNPFVIAVSGEFVGDIPKIFGKYLGDTCLFFDHCMAAPGDAWFYYPSVYAAYRSQWSPDWNVDAGLDEHWVPFYGKEAGEYLKEFHHLVKDCYLKYGVNKEVGEVLNYPVSDLNRMDELLKKAAASVKPGSVEEKRLKLFTAPWPKTIESLRNQLSYERPVYNVYQLLSSEEFTLDGKADEAFWAKAKAIPLMDPNGSSQPLKYPATIKLAWNKAGIYGYCETTYDVFADPNKDLWANDTYEFFFSPGMGKEERCQFVFDGAGKQYLGYQRLLPIPQPGDANWKAPGFKHVSKVENGRWTAEFFIPFEVFKLKNPVKSYDTWLGNAVRNKKKGEGEYSGSCMSLGINANLEMFGIFKFDGKR